MDPDLTPSASSAEEANPYCERVRLLLSLQVDGEATPTHEQEIDDHLPECADCRAAKDVDLMVRAHMTAALAAIAPGELAAPVVQRAIADLRATRSANRFLIASAAAAVLIAVAAGTLVGPQRASGEFEDRTLLEGARATTRLVISAPPPKSDFGRKR